MRVSENAGRNTKGEKLSSQVKKFKSYEEKRVGGGPHTLNGDD